MARNREVIHIDKEYLVEILNQYDESEYVLVRAEITGSDPEDGGADNYAVIQRRSDDKCFSVTYTDWDRYYNFDRDFPEDLIEVFPKQVTVTIYE